MFDNNDMKMSFGRATIVLFMLVLPFLTACKSPVDFLWASDAPAQIDAEDTRKASAATLNNSPINPYRTDDVIPAKVVRVIDGSTIEVVAEGDQFLVSYIGIETPHFEDRILGTEPFGKEAIERNRALVEGKTVFLEKGTVAQDRDGKELRYVYVDDIMINAILVHEGLAQVQANSVGLKYSELLHELQNQAVVERKGGWRNTWRNVIPQR